MRLALPHGCHAWEDPRTAHLLPPAQDVLVNVAPKKANWDLKRDVEKKLNKLERRTQVPSSSRQCPPRPNPSGNLLADLSGSDPTASPSVVLFFFSHAESGRRDHAGRGGRPLGGGGGCTGVTRSCEEQGAVRNSKERIRGEGTCGRIDELGGGDIRERRRSSLLVNEGSFLNQPGGQHLQNKRFENEKHRRPPILSRNRALHGGRWESMFELCSVFARLAPAG